MHEDRAPRDAATVLYNLPGYRVLHAVDVAGAGRQVLVEPVELVGHCPDCGFDSARVHSRAAFPLSPGASQSDTTTEITPRMFPLPNRLRSTSGQNCA